MGLSLAFIVAQLGHVSGMFCKSHVPPLEVPDDDALLEDDALLLLDDVALLEEEALLLEEDDALLLDDTLAEEELLTTPLPVVTALLVPMPPAPPGRSGSTPCTQWRVSTNGAANHRKEAGWRAIMVAPPRSRE
ncbi:Hypothetical protein A7982_03349 [Minicystis rosea]|nr:Hypothetical protein A7982_03349 [Minicystis rosea]